MVYTDKNSVYIAIRNDYYERPKDDQRNSFIYGYRKKLKDERLKNDDVDVCCEEYKRIRDGKRKDSYVLLKSCFISWQGGKVEDDGLCSVLGELIRSGKVPQNDIKRMLSGRRIEDIIAGTDRESKETLLNIYDYLCDCFIREDIQTFFYNIGFSHSMSDKEIPQQRNKSRSRNDESLDMLFGFTEFEAKKGGSPEESTCIKGELATVNDKLSDQSFLDECETLLEFLNDCAIDNNNVFIPLIIDSESGLGVYIVSRSLLDRENSDDKNCYYCCLRFEYDESNVDQFGEYKTHFIEDDERLAQLMVQADNEPDPVLKKQFQEDYQNVRDNMKNGVRRFGMSYVIEGRHYSEKEIKNVMGLFKNLKKDSTDTMGYGAVNEYLSDQVKDSSVKEHFLKYFMEPDEVMAAKRWRKEFQEKMYKQIRDGKLKYSFPSREHC